MSGVGKGREKNKKNTLQTLNLIWEELVRTSTRRTVLSNQPEKQAEIVATRIKTRVYQKKKKKTLALKK